MILVDMSQISVASVMMHLHMTKQTKPDDNMVRHMILNSLRMYRTRFKSEFGELWFFAMAFSSSNLRVALSRLGFSSPLINPLASFFSSASAVK